MVRWHLNCKNSFPSLFFLTPSSRFCLIRPTALFSVAYPLTASILFFLLSPCCHHPFTNFLPLGAHWLQVSGDGREKRENKDYLSISFKINCSRCLGNPLVLLLLHSRDHLCYLVFEILRFFAKVLLIVQLFAFYPVTAKNFSLFYWISQDTPAQSST